MKTSESITNLVTALAVAKKNFKPIQKNGEGKVKGVTKSGAAYEYTYKYALLKDILEATEEALHDNGLVITDLMSCENGKEFINCFLMHKSGEYLMSTIPVKYAPTKTDDPQAMGSGCTYSQRYSYGLMLCLSYEDDDDGARARDNGSKPKAIGNPVGKPEQKPISAGKQFFDKYFDELLKAKTLDDYNLVIVSNKESVQKFLATYKPDVRLATEAEVAKREQAAKVRVGA
jgi:hypothetical protein